MSIKSDRWIKEMAKKGMIEPFAENQVSKGVISYGVSSYGYDMRIADEFEIFTNVHSVVVDPKNFSKESFVRFKGKECIIPPNSFALGKSVEYFRIPRNVLCIVLGKSTYARAGIIVNVTPLEPCYDEQTELLTLKGWKKIKDVKDKEIVATLNNKGELEYHRITAKQKIPFKGELVHIHGRNVDLAVTPSHMVYAKNRYKKDFEFIRADKLFGKYNYELKRDALWKGKEEEFFIFPRIKKQKRRLRMLKKLKSILQVLEEKPLTTVEIIERTKINKNTVKYYLDHLLKEKFIKKDTIYVKRKIGANKNNLWTRTSKPISEMSEYVDELKVKNDYWVQFLGIWLAEGSAYISTKGDFIVKIAAFKKEEVDEIKAVLKHLPFHFMRISTGFKIVNKQLCLYLMRFGHSYEKFVPDWVKHLSPRQIKLFLKGYMVGDGNKETDTITTSSWRIADDLQELILKAGWAAIVRKIPPEKFNKSSHIKAKRNIYKIRISKKQLTPKIYKSSFSKLPYDGFVYDVTVPNHTLYVRRNGKACWSSNCWQGYVTIEISNTTPLPVKVYANEGIAQVLFLESDEECETSYADKKGKYQNQTGIWLPKVKK